MRRLLGIFLVITMLITTSAITSVSAAHYTDIEGHWAENEIVAWSDYGVISGYDGKFSPNRYITRGEFAVILNRLMGYQNEGENVFDDLPDKFYTSSVLKLYKAGVMQGYAGSISPENSLTREEASVMICRALGIETADMMNKNFPDEADVSSWARPYINTMVNTGLLNGADGKLNPKHHIMRSEVVMILDNAVHPILKSGTFENVNTNKILVVGVGEIIVKNFDVKGKIIVTQNVLDGKISFTDSKIENDFVIDNDRSAFIEIKNTQVANKEILKHKAIISGNAGGGGSSGGGGATEGNATINVGNVTAEKGDETLVPVSLSYNKGLTGLMLELSYNSDALTLIGYEVGEALRGLTFTDPGKIDSNPVNFLWDGVDADYTNGCILKLKFKVKDTASSGEYPVDMTVKTACDQNVNAVEITTIDGKVSVNNEGQEQPAIPLVTFSVKGSEYASIQVEKGNKIGNMFPQTPVVEGCTFKGWQDLAGNPVTEETVITESMTVVAVLTIKVTFIEGYGKYADDFAETELTLDFDGNASINKNDIPSDAFWWIGYQKKDYMPNDYEGYNDKYTVAPDFWYIDNGEFKLFDETVVLTENTDVHWMFREISVNALGVAVTVRYDENSSLLDSAKAFIDNAIPLLETAKEAGEATYEELTTTMLSVLEEANLIDNEKFVKKIKFNADFIDALTDQQSVKDIINGDGALEITAANLELLKAVSIELENITFDDILEVESNYELRAMASLAGYDVCEQIFEDSKENYFGVLNIVISEIENAISLSATIPAVVGVAIDPVEDILIPLFEEAEKIALSGFSEEIRYSENPYLQYVTKELDVFEELLTKVDDGKDDRTGYKLKDLISCLNYVEKLIIATDDAACWYDAFEDVDTETAYNAALAKLLTVYNIMNERTNTVEDDDRLPSVIKIARDTMKASQKALKSLERIIKNENTIQFEFQAAINSGKLYDAVNAFKNSPFSNKIDEAIIDDIVSIIEDVAENGIDEFKVETTNITDIDKYEVTVGEYLFSVSRYFVF